RVGVITLRKNFGQTAGLAAGFDHCRGAVVVTMDGDLQHEPEDIPKLLAPLQDGFDIASGWRKDRSDVDSPIRTIPSRVANGLAARISNVELRDFGTTFKAYRREIIEELELHGELHRFIPALAAARGARIAEVPITSGKRHSGTSHYGLSRTWAVLIDLMVLKFLLSYLGRPLRMFAAVGLPLFGLGFLVALAVTVQFYFFTEDIGYGNLIFAALLMILGAQFIGMGLVAEIGARNYARAGKQPMYAIRHIGLGADPPQAAATTPVSRSTQSPHTETPPTDRSATAPQA
ncbi:MAG: glycosyltransferase, partial [Myxococcota bacterium]|nr:glycosyltransferase [Myxococcota bacterium]